MSDFDTPPKKEKSVKHSLFVKCRRICILLILMILIALISVYGYFTNSDYIRNTSIAALEGMTGGNVELVEAKFSQFRQIHLKGVKIKTPAKGEFEENPIFIADEMIIRLDSLKLLRGEFKIDEVVFSNGNLKIWYDRDQEIGNLDLLDFASDPNGTPQYSAIYFRNCMMEYTEIVDDVRGPKVRQELTGKLRPIPNQSVPSYFEFDLKSAQRSTIKNLHLQGKLDLMGQLDSQAHLNFKLEDIDITTLPESWQQPMINHVQYPHGNIDLIWKSNPQDHSLTFSIENGHFQINRFHAMIENFNTQIIYKNNTFDIKMFEGRLKNHCDFYAKGLFDDLSISNIFNYLNDSENIPHPLSLSRFKFDMGTSGLNIPTNQWDFSNPHDTQSKVLTELVKQVLPWGPKRMIEVLTPSGQIDMVMTLQRDIYGPNPVQFNGQVDCHSANFTYAKFPYPLTGVAGKATFNSKEVIVGPLSIEQDDMKLTYDGKWTKLKQRKPDYEMTVNVNNGLLDETLYNALNPMQQSIWDLFNPTNRINAVYYTSRVDGQRSQWDLNVDLLNVDATYTGFKLPMTDIQGHLTITRDHTDIRVDRAKASTGELSIVGDYSYRSMADKNFQCKINYKDMLINETLSNYLPQKHQDFYERVRLNGRSDGIVTVQSKPTSKDRIKMDYDVDIEATYRNGPILYKAFPYPVENATANVKINRNGISINSLKGFHNGGEINLNGFYKNQEDYKIHIEAESIIADQALYGAMGYAGSQLCERLNPRGSFNAILDIERTDTSQQQVITGLIEAVNSGFKFKDLNYTFENVTGVFLIDENKINFQDILSKENNTEIRLNGELKRDFMQLSEMNFNIKNGILHRKLFEAFPQELQAHIDYIKPTGNWNGNVKILYQQDKEQHAQWIVSGDLYFNEVALVNPMPTTELSGSFTGKSTFNAHSDLFTLNGDFLGQTLKIKQRPLENLKSYISYDSRKKELLFSDINGRLCNGNLFGQSKITFTKEGSGYELQIKCRDVELPQFLMMTNSDNKKKKKLQGQIMGNYNISKANSLSPRIGSFKAFVNNAVLGELPIAAQFLHIPNLSWPREGAFNEVTLEGNIHNEKILFNVIFMRGSALSLNGVGEMVGDDNKLDLIFLVGSPHDIPPVPGFTDLLTVIKPALIHLHVSGTFENPIVKTIAFGSFQKLLNYFSGAKLGSTNKNKN